MYLELQENESVQDITAFSLKLNFDSKENLPEEPVFKFGTDFNSKDVSVRQERYDGDAQTMTLYVAGRNPVIEKEKGFFLEPLRYSRMRM